MFRPISLAMCSVASLGALACGAAAEHDGASAVSVVEPALGAAPALIAIGNLPGAASDRSGASAAPLENGTAGNLLGGIGSGLAHLSGQRFLALPDRGPNAVSYAAGVDDTTSYIPRIQSLRLRLTPSAAGATLPFSLTPQLTATTLLYAKEPLAYGNGSAFSLPSGAPALNTDRKHYFSGRSDNFDPAQPSSSVADARLDPEGIRVAPDGVHVYVSDEYGPYLYEFERTTGKRTRSVHLPAELAIAKPSASGADEIAGNSSGRVSNKGMEGLALTPDGRSLVGAMQSPLIQDGGTSGSVTRIVSIALDTGAIKQFAYPLTNIGSADKPKYPAVSEILALDDHEFLVDERDSKGLGDDSEAGFKTIYRIDLRGAADVSGLSGEADLKAKAVAKTPFLDIVASLRAYGLAAADIPAKLEGMAFGPDVRIDGASKRTLYLSTDNDFLPTITDTHHPDGIDNPNQFFVFAFEAVPSTPSESDVDAGTAAP